MEDVDPLVGTVLHDRYKVLERLTAGSMGVVYLAERVGLRRQVAIKVLHESYATTADGVRRFEVEARAMSRLSHPNCVAVTDFGVANSAPYLVMDFVSGESLRAIIQREGRMPAARAIEIIRQVLAGLAHAHGQRIIHRDIKPENILVSTVEGHSEQVRILDFGLAKLRDEKTVTTGIALGTPGYMSPEQTVNAKVDERADVYGAGIILYELLVGWKPFKASSPFEVMRMHREVPPPPLAHAASDLSFSRQLEEAVQRALAKQPADRFRSVEAFAKALENTPEHRGPEASRAGRGVLMATGAAIAAAAIGIFMWWSQRGSETQPERRPSAVAPRKVKKHAPRPTARPSEKATSADASAPVDQPPSQRDDVARLRALAASGDRAGAIRGLDALRRSEPRRADVYYVLGALYTETQAWKNAVEAYSTALALAPGYRSDKLLISDVVEALADNAAQERAAAVIASQLGKAALPRLEEAARSANPRLRARAEKLRSQLAARP